MTESLIDIYNNILEYDNVEIIVIIDDDMVPWFSASDITKILGYVNTSKTINDHVNNDDKKTFDELKQYIKEIPSNSQPHSILINESGLYSLILSSKMEKAQEFKKWVTKKVLPSIRKYGYYETNNENKKNLEKLNKQIQKLKEDNKTLKHNQKRNKYNDGGKVYAIKPAGKNKGLIRIGKTDNLTNRLYNYNSSVSDNFTVVYQIDVDDPIAVELCIRSALRPYIYRSNKDYYKCPIIKIKELFNTCDDLVKNDYLCHVCNSRVNSLDEIINHSIEKHNVNIGESMFINFYNEQKRILL